MTDGWRSRAQSALRNVLGDALYRGSLLLLANTVSLSAFGFAFWTFAARTYPATAVGAFSGVTSGIGLLAAIAALGLPNMMIRHLADANRARHLFLSATAAISVVGGSLCLVTVVLLGPRLPAALHLQQRGDMVALVTVLVVLNALSTIIDASLVALRASHIVLIRNLAGSVAKLGSLFLLTRYGSSGLLIAYGCGLVIATGIGGLDLGRRVPAAKSGASTPRLLRRYLSMTAGNYVAAILGILPTTVVPLEVLVVRGAAATAWFTSAFLIAGFLNFIPSTTAEVLFAEASRQGTPLGSELRKALRGIYWLLLPPLIVLVVAAPFVLRLFGDTYSAAATGCLRVLALSALLTGGTYLVDALLIARDRMAAYIAMNGLNAALVIGCVGLLLPRGLTAAAAGWTLAQGMSLLVGLIMVMTGRSGRHRAAADRAPAVAAATYRGGTPRPRHVIYAFEPQIRQLLATWPMMPTSLIAQRIGWNEPLGLLLERVTELRSSYAEPAQHFRSAFLPGQAAQCGLWFPPAEIPVGSGQTRAAADLPVLTMITGYSHWLSAVLLPSRAAEDLFAGLWQLLEEIGAVPRALSWESEAAVGQWQEGGTELTAACQDFCRNTGTRAIIGKIADPETRGLIEQARTNLEHSFLPGRVFGSPADFNDQILRFLAMANTRPHPTLGQSPVDLLVEDRAAMLPLPPRPSVGWRVAIKVADEPFIGFDGNSYSVDPAAIRREVRLVADLNRVRVFGGGRLLADHPRAWVRGRTIANPSHLAAAGLRRPEGQASLTPDIAAESGG